MSFKAVIGAFALWLFTLFVLYLHLDHGLSSSTSTAILVGGLLGVAYHFSKVRETA